MGYNSKSQPSTHLGVHEDAVDEPLWPVDDDGKLQGLSYRSFRLAARTYTLRWRGSGQSHPPPASPYRALLAWVGSFLSLLLIGGMQQWINQHWSIPLLLATFGPAAALVFGLPSLPASQPLNCFGGTIVCGIVGLFFRVLVGRQAWLAMGLATACAISLMELMSLAYPPGLATTILLTTLVPETTFQLSSIGHNAPHNWCVRPLLEHSLLLRFTEGCKIFLSAIMGHVVILTVAMFVNNLDQDKGYPLRWL